MKVSKRSWHFKLYTFWQMIYHDSPLTFFELLARKNSLRFDWKPKNLCRYFWLIVASTLLTTILCLLAGIFVVLAMAILWIPFTIYDSDWNEERRNRRKAKQAAKLEEEAAKPPKQPGLLSSFVKAKKAKVCPMIEVVD